MLHVQNVPGFTHILIHIGNDDDDTAGCLLVADLASLRSYNLPGESTTCYKRIYPPIAKAIESGEEVWITIQNSDASKPVDQEK
jgi:hypothetical protein